MSYPFQTLGFNLLDDVDGAVHILDLDITCAKSF